MLIYQFERGAGMNKWIAALSACAAVSAGAFAYGSYAGDAALGGFVGSLIGSDPARAVVASAPAVVTPAPVVVSARVVIVERYGPAVVYYDGGHRWREHEWRAHRSHRHHWDKDDD